MIKYNFYFRASNTERRPLAQCDNLSDCICVMQQFMDNHILYKDMDKQRRNGV